MGKKKTASESMSRELTLFHWLADSTDGVEIKGAKSKYVAVNGNMFGFIGQEGRLTVRLPKVDRETFLEKYPECVSVQYDTVMKEYVAVPESILNNKRQLRKLFDSSVEYAFSLKPKATTKPTKKARKHK